MKSLFLITDRQCHLYCIFYSIKYLNNDISCYSETEDNWWCWNGTLGSYIATPGLSLKSSRVSWEIQVQIQSLKVAFSLSEYSIWNIQKCRLRLEISKIVDCLYRQTYIYIYIYIYMTYSLPVAQYLQNSSLQSPENSEPYSPVIITTPALWWIESLPRKAEVVKIFSISFKVPSGACILFGGAPLDILTYATLASQAKTAQEWSSWWS